MLFRPLSELILCITCLDLFLCNLFISLHSLYGWDISAGEDQPNLAAHVLRHVPRFNQCTMPLLEWVNVPF